MSYIFNYKYIDGKVCFPITNKVCVCNKLNELNIGYVIDNDVIYGDSDVYNDYLAKGYNKVKYDTLIEDINNKLIKLDIDLLLCIRDILYEYDK